MKIFITLIASVFYLSTFSQSTDNRILEVYGEKYVENLKTKSPRTLNYLSFFADNGYYISDLPSEGSFKDISSCTKKSVHVASEKIPDFNIHNPKENNILFYNIGRSFNERTTYKLGNTGKAIVFYSEKELTNMFNEKMENKK